MVDVNDLGEPNTDTSYKIDRHSTMKLFPKESHFPLSIIVIKSGPARQVDPETGWSSDLTGSG